MREICFDTETTGLEPDSGHRIVEIGGVEMVNRVLTGTHYHVYINPERDMPTEAFQIHGLSEAFLADKPVFADIAEDLLEFIGDATLVIHNAPFDMKFINAELRTCGRLALPVSRATDTLAMARAKFPGAQASLDALCKRFEIDNSARTRHGALLDAELLAEVYIELTGGRQTGLSFNESGDATRRDGPARGAASGRPVRPARPHAPSPEEERAHRAFLEKLGDPIWAAAD